MRPRTGCQTPTSTPRQRALSRAARSDDAKAVAGLQRKADVLHDDLLAAGRHDAGALDDQAAGGGCSAMGVECDGSSASRSVRRCQPCRAATKPRQFAIARSTGASARALRIEPAMMMPRGGLLIDHEIGADGEHARLQHHAQHSGCRSEAAGNVAGAPLAAMYLALASPHRAAIRLVIPIAVSTSALRRLVSASDWRAIAKPVAARVGSRVMISVSIVIMPRTMAPTSAASPM